LLVALINTYDANDVKCIAQPYHQSYQGQSTLPAVE
jgi:hypothetical protein